MRRLVAGVLLFLTCAALLTGCRPRGLSGVTYTLTVGATGPGQVAPTGVGIHSAGKLVTLRVTPVPGMYFRRWTGPNGAEVVRTSGEWTLRMGADKQVTAEFGASPCVIALASAVEASHTMVVAADGHLYAWGRNDEGQYGDGTLISRAKPVAVPVPDNVTPTAVAISFRNGLITTSTGQVYGWGRNDQGQIGDGTTIDRPTPVPVIGLPGAVVAAAVGWDFSLALTAAGEVYTWGANSAGQLGEEGPSRTLPSKVPGLPAGIKAIAAGGRHCLALDSTGGVWAWGLNDRGQLGDGTTTSRPSPARVRYWPFPGYDPPPIADVTAITAAYQQSAALTASGSVYTWGDNQFNKLDPMVGANPVVGARYTGFPQPAAGVSLGVYHTSVWLPNGEVWTVGRREEGQFGTGVLPETRDRAKALLPPGVAITGLSTGSYNVYGLTAEGDLYAWGLNAEGQAGVGTTESLVLTPTLVQWQ